MTQKTIRAFQRRMFAAQMRQPTLIAEINPRLLALLPDESRLAYAILHAKYPGEVLLYLTHHPQAWKRLCATSSVRAVDLGVARLDVRCDPLHKAIGAGDFGAFRRVKQTDRMARACLLRTSLRH